MSDDTPTDNLDTEATADAIAGEPTRVRLPMCPDEGSLDPGVRICIPEDSDGEMTAGVQVYSPPLPHAVRIWGFHATSRSRSVIGIVQHLQVEGSDRCLFFCEGAFSAEDFSTGDVALRSYPLLQAGQRATVTLRAGGDPGEEVTVTAHLLVDIV